MDLQQIINDLPCSTEVKVGIAERCALSFLTLETLGVPTMTPEIIATCGVPIGLAHLLKQRCLPLQQGTQQGTQNATGESLPESPATPRVPVAPVSASPTTPSTPLRTLFSQGTGSPGAATFNATQAVAEAHLEIYEDCDNPDVNAITRAIVKSVVAQAGFHPAASVKTLIARMLLDMFPAVRSSDDNCPESVFYRPHFYKLVAGKRKLVTPGGTIEERLKTVRPRQAKRPRQVQSSMLGESTSAIVVDDLDVNNDVLTTLARQFASVSGVDEIEEKMSETYEVRKKALVSVSTAQYLSAVPLRVSQKDLWDNEFKRRCPGSVPLVTGMTDYAASILCMARELVIQKPATTRELASVLESHAADKRPLTDEMWAIACLPYLMRPTQQVGKERKGVLHMVNACAAAFITIINEQENLTGLGSRHQTGAVLVTRPQTFFVFEGAVHEVGNILEACDRVFKLLFCLNLEYPVACSHVWQFLECFVYKVKPGHVQSTVESFHRVLKAVSR